MPGFSLPPATVAWVDYSGQLHIGDVATLARHVAGTIPAWAGAGWLVQAGGRIYGTGSAIIREFDPATGTTLRLGPGIGVFPSADGRHAYVERTSTSLAGLRAGGREVLRRLHTPAGGTWNRTRRARSQLASKGLASSSARVPTVLPAARGTSPPGTRRQGR